MSLNVSRVSRLEALPMEIFRSISGLLYLWELKDLSRASKMLREACLPSLFQCVKFRFSEDGFEELKSLSNSEARYHVVSFTYGVPELLKADTLEFEQFKYRILSPDDYVNIAKELDDAGCDEDECLPYMFIYKTVYNTWKEQRSIVDNGVDLAVLSSILKALPRLTAVHLSFCKAFDRHDDLQPTFIPKMIVAAESYEYHVRIVSDAIQRARNWDVAVHAITLSGLALPYYMSREDPDLGTLSESLRKLLEPVQVLRVSHSQSALKIISLCTLSIHQLDMCHVMAEHNDLKDFLEKNARSICSIGFHKVQITGSSRPESKLLDLSSSILCRMLNISKSTPCRAADCGCHPVRKEGWRLLLSNDRLSRFA